jgi:diguanylate cyclase (GGDEF)-like protein
MPMEGRMGKKEENSNMFRGDNYEIVRLFALAALIAFGSFLAPPFAELPIPPINVSIGLIWAFLLRSDRRLWFPVLSIGWGADVVSMSFWGAEMAHVIATSTLNVLCALLAMISTRVILKRRPNLSRSRDSAILVCTGVFTSLLWGAGDGFFYSNNYNITFQDALIISFLSAFIGLLLTMPPALLFLDEKNVDSMSRDEGIAAALLTILTFFACMVVFKHNVGYPLLFCIPPIIFLMVITTGSGGAVILSWLPTFFALSSLQQMSGPFQGAPSDLVGLSITFQLFVVAMCLPAISLGIFRDELERRVRELKWANIRLSHYASVDPLTGLDNRRGIENFMKDFGRADVLVIDIDHFKKLNDTLGHDAGDEALKALASILASQANRLGGRAGRWGGEEFVVFVPMGYGREAVHSIQREIRSLGLFHPASPSGYLTVSGGWTTMGMGEDYRAAIKRADAALYQAKEKGRDLILRSTDIFSDENKFLFE